MTESESANPDPADEDTELVFLDDASQESLGLDGFLQPDASDGISIEDLGRAYAELMHQGDDPYEERHAETELAELQETVDSAGREREDEAVEVSPRSILEAMLFVGNDTNEPLTSRMIASFMRGVTPEEIDELVLELNESYDQDATPYKIVAEMGGYRLTLRQAYHSLRDRFYGRIREARLSQSAIDVLSIVAYRQPVSRDEVDEFRGMKSGSLLSQLTRRRLLQLTPKSSESPARYSTTKRFLELFGLESIDDLPQSEDLDRWTG